MKNKSIINIFCILGILSILPLIYAQEITELPNPVKQGNTLTLTQSCCNCTYINLTSVLYPNGTKIYEDFEMVETSPCDWGYDFTSTNQLGKYVVCGFGDLNGVNEPFCYGFGVTPSGSEKIGSGEGLGIIGILFLMIVIGITFFIIGFKVENIVVKIGAFCFSIIVFIMAVLYIIIFAQQNLYGFEGLVSGAENFWFVMKMLLTIGILALFIIVALILIKAWKIKRGYIDI